MLATQVSVAVVKRQRLHFLNVNCYISLVTYHIDSTDQHNTDDCQNISY